MDGYREIFFSKKDNPTLEPVTGRNVRNSPLQTKHY